MKAACQAYLDGLNACDADAVIALFSADAVIEDPVGTPVKRGEEIVEWFRGAARAAPKLELAAPIRGSHANAAVVVFTVETEQDGRRTLLHTLDVMHFDDDGKITRLDAYWGPEDRIEL